MSQKIEQTQELSKIYNIVLAGDNGNSKFKGYLSFEDGLEEYVEEKSLTSKLTSLPMFPDETIEKSLVNLTDNMIIELTSKSLKLPGMYAVGEKASKVGRSRNMNISIGSKHEDDLPVIQTLGLIATKVVQRHFKLNERLADTIYVNVEYATAIPAAEYTKQAARALEDKFLNEEHTVTLHIADKEYVTVKINFLGVKVTQEGNPATFAFVYGDPELLNDFKTDYPNEIVSNSYFEDKKILNVDIGDGTTEFVYTVAGKPIADLSSGERLGVGHAAKDALNTYKKEINLNIKLNRQDFMDAVINDSHVQHDEAKNAMLLATTDQAQAIAEKVEEIFTDLLRGDLEVIAVFGGGAVQFKADLKEMLKDLADKLNVKLLWIPDNYASKINAIGLKELNNRVFFKK